MKFFSGALAAVLPVLPVPPAASAAALQVEQPEGFDPKGFDREFSPMPPAPGSDAVWPAAWTRFMERRAEYEEGLEDDEGVRLSSQLADVNRGVGSYTMLVLLMRFADHDPDNLPSKDDIDRLFNEHIGVDPLVPLAKQAGNDINPTGSVSEVFKVNSGGKLNLNFVVTDWVSLAHNQSYYASDEDGEGKQGKSKSRFKDGIREALAAFNKTNPDFDWNQFTYIRTAEKVKVGRKHITKIVDKMHGFGALHSGHGAEFGGTGSSFRIWSEKGSGVEWTPPRLDTNANPYGIVDRYYTTAVNNGLPPNPSIMHFGTAVHEIGHSLGLPDLYDTSERGQGLGNFSPMAKGNFGFDDSGHYPTSFDPYCKILMGWATPTLIDEDGVYEVKAGVNEVWKIARGFAPTLKKPEYLLIENRQPTGYDSKMKGGGIAIYHVDEHEKAQNTPGFPGMGPDEEGRLFPENGRHYKVALLASDGRYELEQGGSQGKADMLWSDSSDMVELGSNTTVYPNTVQYQKGKLAETGIVIDNFSESNMTMTFSVTFKPVPSSDHDSPVALFTNAKQTGYLRAQATIEGKDS